MSGVTLLLLRRTARDALHWRWLGSGRARNASGSAGVHSRRYRRATLETCQDMLCLHSLLQARAVGLQNDMIGLQQRVLGLLKADEGFEILGNSVEFERALLC